MLGQCVPLWLADETFLGRNQTVNTYVKGTESKKCFIYEFNSEVFYSLGWILTTDLVNTNLIEAMF
jgi:hypothetical protein